MTAYQDLVIADGPSWYAVLNDASGAVTPLVGSTTLAVTGAPTYSQAAPAPLIASIKYPGTGTDYHQAASGANAAFDLGDGPFTIEFWYLSNTATAVVNFTGKGTGAYLTRGLVTTHQLDLRKSGTGDCFVTTTGFTDTTTWHHVVFTRVAATQPICYVDGVARAGTYTAQTFTNITGGFSLGVDAAAKTTGPFNGWLSNVALYTKVLTAVQVATHYATVFGVPNVAMSPMTGV